MKNNRDFQIEKTGYNYRTRKHRDILAVVLDANNEVIDAINPGTGNHRAALEWAEWRAESIRTDYPATVRMEVYCGDDEIAIITFKQAETTADNIPTAMGANDLRELISCLRYELQQYHDNASRGGTERRRNMILLRWDIRSFERQLKAIGAYPRRKSINGIMNQSNRLMSVCNAVRNFKRTDVIRAIAFRYYDNIRACAGRFNYNDNSEYSKEYSRAQYMNA